MDQCSQTQKQQRIMKDGSAREEKQTPEVRKTVEGEKHTAVGLAAVENKT